MACIRKHTVFCVLLIALYAMFSQVEAADECFSHSDCTSFFSPYCCNTKFYQDNVCKYSCVGESCSFDSNCAPSESCCSDDTCATSCVGKSCTFDSDCATGECCDSDDTCKTGDCNIIEGLAGWIVAVIVISVIVVIVVPIAVVVACCCCAAAVSRRPVHGGFIVTQPATAATETAVVSTQKQQQQQYPVHQGQPMYFQNPQQYPPPPYQPLDTVAAYPPGSSGPIAMTPQTEIKQ